MAGHSFVSVVDFGPKVEARSILVFGESADPKSPHYFRSGDALREAAVQTGVVRFGGHTGARRTGVSSGRVGRSGFPPCIGNKRALYYTIMAAVASVAGGYVWEDPGDSIMIQVGLDLVERLGAAVQQGLGGGPRGTEIGGILLGRTLPGFGRAVLIEDFELAPCEHLRGGSYTLSAKDKRTLGTRLARHRASDVVGYFRSQTRPGMYLDQDDFAVFSQYFPEPWQVFLLVRPSTEGPADGRVLLLGRRGCQSEVSLPPISIR